ncbi:MAG: flavodoxin family protein [Bdellovibrionota bacterium]
MKLKRTGLSQKKKARADYSEAKTGKISSLLGEAKKPRDQKILAILGAAPGGKNTGTFLKEKYPGAEIVNLLEKKVAPYVYGDAEEDDFPKIIEQILASNLTIFATPVYWYAMSGVMKNFFDRLSHLMRGKYKFLGDAIYGKKFAVVVTGSDDRLPFGFEVPFASTAMYLGMDYLGASYHSVGH